MESQAPKSTQHPNVESDHYADSLSDFAESYNVTRNSDGDEIPAGTSGPKYDGNHYAGSLPGDVTHKTGG